MSVGAADTLCPLEDEVDTVGAGGIEAHGDGGGHRGEGLGQGVGIEVICTHKQHNPSTLYSTQLI